MNEYSLDPTALYYTSMKDVQRQGTLGPDSGVLEMSDPQYVCSNDTSLGGTCTSGERVVRARSLCSKCIVSDFPVYHAIVSMFTTSHFRIPQLIKLQALGVGSENAGEMLFNRDIAPVVTPEESLASQISLQFNNGILELADYQYVCRNDNSKHGRGCYSGEKVSRANQACSKCQVHYYPSPLLLQSSHNALLRTSLTRKQAERRYEAYFETATGFDEDMFMPDFE